MKHLVLLVALCSFVGLSTASAQACSHAKKGVAKKECTAKKKTANSSAKVAKVAAVKASNSKKSCAKACAKTCGSKKKTAALNKSAATEERRTAQSMHTESIR